MNIPVKTATAQDLTGAARTYGLLVHVWCEVFLMSYIGSLCEYFMWPPTSRHPPTLIAMPYAAGA